MGRRGERRQKRKANGCARIEATMKPRGKSRSEVGRAASATDSNTMMSRTTVRCAARQVCIGDMEEELHNAFAMAR